MLVFGETGIPVILFATSKGRYFQNKDFGLVDSIAQFVDAGAVKVYCPDSIDELSWYNYGIHPAHRALNYNQFEKVIIQEVYQQAAEESGHKRVILGGCSFGGYHALNLAFKHPALVAAMFSLGGAYDIKQFVEGHFDENCYYNNPPSYLPDLSGGYLDELRRMAIVLGTGHDDICRGDNLHMAWLLSQKGVRYWLDDRPGVGHDWPWWNQMLPHYLGTYLAQIG